MTPRLPALLLAAWMLATGAAAQQPPDGEPPPAVAAGVRERIDDALECWRTGGRALDIALPLRAGGPAALPYLEWLVRARRDRVPLAQVCAALVSIDEVSAVRTLEGLLRSSDAPARRTAARTLGTTRRRRSLVLLIGALTDADALVRLHAARGLPGVARRLDRVDAAVDGIARLLRGGGPAGAPLEALAALGTAGAHRLVRDRLDDRRPAMRVAALRSLPAWKDAKDARLVRRLLSDADRAVRKEACLAAGRLGDRRAVERLLELLADPHRGLMRNAHWALQRIAGIRLAPEPELWAIWWKTAGERWVEQGEIRD